MVDLTVWTLDTLFRIVLPSLADHGKLLRDADHRHFKYEGVVVKAYRGYSPSNERRSIRTQTSLSVFCSRSCVTSIRVTINSFAAVMANLDSLSQYFAIFLIDYNNPVHKCHDVATHWNPSRDGKQRKWDHAFNMSELRTRCQQLGGVAPSNLDEFFHTWKHDSEGNEQSRGRVLLQATHFKFVVLGTPNNFESGSSVVRDVGGIIIPVMEECQKGAIEVVHHSDSDDNDEGMEADVPL